MTISTRVPPPWLQSGADVVEYTGPDGGQVVPSLTTTRIDRVLKRYVVLENGNRFPLDTLTVRNRGVNRVAINPSYSLDDFHPNYVEAAGRIVHEVQWGVANLPLSSLVEVALDLDRSLRASPPASAEQPTADAIPTPGGGRGGR